MRLPSAPVSLVGGTPVVHPDADYGSQFSVGGLIQDTIQQASNRLKDQPLPVALRLGTQAA